MSTTDYRAMCAELLAWAEHTSSHYYKQPDVLTRARALLAQQPVSPPYKLPEPEGPTDEELLDLADWEVWDHQLLAFARAAIARHGRPTPQPVAVSERLDWRRPNALPTPEATND